MNVNEIADAIIAQARDEALVTMQQRINPPAGIVAEDYIESDVVLSASLYSRTLTDSIKIAAGMLTEITRVCIKIIYLAAVDETWKYDGEQEYNSLYDWAYTNMSMVIENKDYISRWVNTVNNMLVPMQDMVVTDKNTGEIITVDNVISSANIRDLKQVPASFKEADDDEKEELMTLMATGATSQDIRKVHDRILDNAKVDTPSIQVIPLKVTQNVDGDRWDVTIPRPLTDAELTLFEALMGKRIEVQFA